MTFYDIRNGWVTRLDGVDVIKRPADMPHTTWVTGGPHGILWHYTAGCNDDIIGTLESNGFGGATFCIGRDGKVRQYASLDTATWHAMEASHHYVGIEHTAYPGRCELTDEQLESSARLSAALVDHFNIPVKKTNGPDLVSGFKDHRDGTTETWNDNGHTDHLYRWTWREYLARVRAVLKGDDMTEAQKAQLQYLKTFVNGVKAFADGTDVDLSARPEGFKDGYRTGAKLAAPAPVPPAELPAHTHDLPGTTGPITA